VSKPAMKLIGLEGVQKNLRSAVKAVGKKPMKDAVLEAADKIVQEAKRRAPYRTGRLRRDIGKKVTLSSKTRAVVEVGHTRSRKEGRVIFWAPMQEFGTPHHAAHPYLRPAFERHKRGAAQDIGERFWDNIKLAW